MGFGAVTGKLTCLRDLVRLQFKEKDRAFRKNETHIIDFEYVEVEDLKVESRWFRPTRFVFETRALSKLDLFPGSQLGKVEMRIEKSSVQTAKKIIGLIDFRRSETILQTSESRLERSTEK